MTAWVALLRGVNVGGNNKVPMAELKALCEGLGFASVRTYIASGNVVFASEADEGAIRAAIEQALLARYGKPLGVLVRSGAELAAVAAGNPFAASPGNRVLALFTQGEPSLEGVRHQTDELLAPGPRVIYIRYGEAMAAALLGSEAEAADRASLHAAALRAAQALQDATGKTRPLELARARLGA